MVGYMKDNIVRVGEKIRNSSQEIENIKKRILEIRSSTRWAYEDEKVSEPEDR
jgi:non-ribosomal peptide synthetase component E (peptide arylation enzyme)